jgi:hypothetical protein
MNRANRPRLSRISGSSYASKLLSRAGDGSTLTLDFTTGILDSRLTFERLSNATFINSSGLVQYADANMVVNSVMSGPATPTGWSLVSGGAGATIPSTGVRRLETTTAAQNWIQNISNYSTAQGLLYSTTAVITAVSGQHYQNTMSPTGGASVVQFYRNGVAVAGGTGGAFQTAQTGVITCVWQASSSSGNGFRIGVGSTGSNVANGVCEFSELRTVPGSYPIAPYFANTNTANPYHGPRFDYDPTTLAPRGLLLEGQAVNLATYSEDYSQAAWSKVSIDRTTGQSSPDNATGATLISENTTSFVKHSLERSITITPGVHTLSVWAKEPSSNSRRYLCVQVADGQATAARYTIVADLQTGTITASGANNGTAGAPTNTGHSITAYPNGWYRLTITMNCVASPLYPAVILSNIATLYGGSNQPFYSATTPYKGMVVWGAQVEVGSAASSYIVTGASTATRVADFCVMTGTNFSSWYQGGTQGTFYADWFGGVREGASGSTNRTVLSTDDVANKHLHLMQTAAAGNLRVADFGGANNVTTANTLTSGARTKGAFGYNGSSASVCLNGGTVATGSSLSFSVAPTWLVIGATSTNGTSLTDANVVLNNSIRQIKYWPTRLADGTLQGLTT